MVAFTGERVYSLRVVLGRSAIALFAKKHFCRKLNDIEKACTHSKTTPRRVAALYNKTSLRHDARRKSGEREIAFAKLVEG